MPSRRLKCMCGHQIFILQSRGRPGLYFYCCSTPCKPTTTVEHQTCSRADRQSKLVMPWNTINLVTMV